MPWGKRSDRPDGDGRIIDFRYHPLFAERKCEPDDSYVLPHGMTWGEFKRCRSGGRYIRSTGPRSTASKLNAWE